MSLLTEMREDGDESPGMVTASKGGFLCSLSFSSTAISFLPPSRLQRGLSYPQHNRSGSSMSINTFNPFYVDLSVSFTCPHLCVYLSSHYHHTSFSHTQLTFHSGKRAFVNCPDLKVRFTIRKDLENGYVLSSAVPIIVLHSLTFC